MRDMPAYAVAQLSIHNPEVYDRYVAAFPPVIERYGGRVLAADNDPDVLEGRWDYDRFVLLEFPDRASLESWATSPEYREIVRDRLAASHGVVLYVRGLS
jgi:uncharacterized protein (DUF1330 family)